MKKIIIVNNNLNIGGVQSSLIGLLKEISGIYDVTLLIFNLDKKHLGLIPENVKVRSLSSPYKYLGMSQSESKKSVMTFLSRSFWAFLTRLFGRSTVIGMMSPFQKKIKGYDCAISYLHESPQKSFYGGCNEFVLKKIKANQKIAWLHCDFKLCGANNKKSEKIYSDFDNIVACSEGTKTSFVECMPELKDKCVAIRNCNDYSLIRAKAYDKKEYNKDYFNIVTVARLSEEKCIDRVLYAVYEAKKRGYKVMYHIVGDGQERGTLIKLVNDLDISDNVKFYGEQANPYIYIAGADLFMLPSMHEAAPMVFDESASLGVPILCTKTTSTDEMILENDAGFVCENSQEGVTNSLLSILADFDNLKRISEKLKNKTFTNNKPIDAFRNLVK